MFFHYYDISPGLIGLIIWGIISFLFSDENINTDSLIVIATDNDSSYAKEHISLLLNEKMINDFL